MFIDIESIIDLNDLKGYKANVKEPLKSEWENDIYYFPRAPASGPVLQLMLNILSGFTIDETMRLDELTYHRIVESMKHGYAIRSTLADPAFYPEESAKLEGYCTDELFLQSLRDNITDMTHDIPYYNPIYALKEDHGTLHISTLDENGQAAAATSTVNMYFGSKMRGKRTGIVFNDGMDDFSNPGYDNGFDVPPSPINFIAAGKRPVSSMKGFPLEFSVHETSNCVQHNLCCSHLIKLLNGSIYTHNTA